MRLHLSCPSAADMSTNRAATPQHFWQKMKKRRFSSSFLLVRSMGLAPQPYGRRRFCAFFCAANAVAITPGTKNSALCCFLNVPFKSLTPLQKKKTCTMNVQVIFFGAVDGTCSATLRAQAFRTPFFAPLTRLLSRRGLKTAHCAVFLTSRSSPILSCKKNNLHDECASYFFGAVDRK